MQAHICAAQTWAERAQAELGAARRFRELAARLARADAPLELTELARRAEADEERHALLCARMARTLGHARGFAFPEGARERDHAYSWSERADERDRLLLDIVLMCCITESINASLMQTLYHNAKGGDAGELLHSILRDEVKHAQLGWAYLARESQRRDCSFISSYLGEMISRSARTELLSSLNTAQAYLVQDQRAATLSQLGVLPHHARFEQLCATVTDVLIPGFEHFMIDPRELRSWLDTQRIKQTERDAEQNMREGLG